MDFITFLCLLIPVLLGCFSAKRYNIIMGVISMVFYSYLIPFAYYNFGADKLINDKYIIKGIEILNKYFTGYINLELECFLIKIGLDSEGLLKWIPFVLVLLAFLIMWATSAKLKKIKKRLTKE